MTVIDTTAASPAPANPDLERVGGYAKAIAYVVLTVAAVFVTVPSADFNSPSVILQAIIAAAGAVPVYLFTSNRAKTISAVVAGIAQGVFLIAVQGTDLLTVEPGQYIGIVLAALAAAGVYALPNKPNTPTPVALDVATLQPGTLEVVGQGIFGPIDLGGAPSSLETPYDRQ